MIWDEGQAVAEWTPGSVPTDSRFAELLSDNNLEYTMAIGSTCANMVGGSDPDSTASAGFDKHVALGNINPDNFAYHSVEFSPPPW